MDVSFTNGRITSDNSVVYDAAGNIVSKGTGATLRTDTFDASGRRSSTKDRWASSGGQGATVNERQTDHIVDGDGRPVIEKLGARQYSPTPGTLTMAVYKYQVWSSVLGQAVATMDPSGNQIENRIYAGSTLIATARGRSTTGTSADDAIDFHVKEPVTNTTVTYAYNATTSNWATAEQEPFGQNISSIDPYIEEWNNYAQVLNGAQDPEWQCVLYEKMNGDFTSMPTHCAKAAWQVEFAIAKVERNESLESLKRMKDSPLQRPSIPGVESETKDNLALAARATFKPNGEKADGNCRRGPDGRFLEECQNEPNSPTEVESVVIPKFPDASSGSPFDIPARISGSVDENQRVALQTALNSVESRLKTYSACAKLFGGAEKAIEALKKVEFQFKAGEKPTTLDGTPRTPIKAIDAATDRASNRIVINTNGGFMTRGYYTAVLTGFGNITRTAANPYAGDGFAAFVILHELGHLMDIYGKNDSDAGDTKKEKKNNEKIKACL